MRTMGMKYVCIHTGKHFTWFMREDSFLSHAEEMKPFFKYADNVWKQITSWWEIKPSRTVFYLWMHNLRGQGKDGFCASNISELQPIVEEDTPGIGVIEDAFFNIAHGIKGFHGYVLIAHETTNLLTGQIVSGSWPADWWANHHSPFPAMVSIEVERVLVPEVAFHDEQWYYGELPETPPEKLPPQLHPKWAQEIKMAKRERALYKMFKELKDIYGWAMFRRAFTMMREDKIDLNRIGENSSRLRTNYVTAYLTLGAREDITRYFQSGSVPNFDSEMMKGIMAARQTLIEASRKITTDAWKLSWGWELFRKGNYEDVIR